MVVDPAVGGTTASGHVVGSSGRDRWPSRLAGSTRSQAEGGAKSCEPCDAERGPRLERLADAW